MLEIKKAGGCIFLPALITDGGQIPFLSPRLRSGLLALLNLYKGLFLVHIVEQRPEDYKGQSCADKIVPVAGPFFKAFYEDVCEDAEVENLDNHIDKDGIAADDYKGEGPLFDIEHIDDEEENGKAQVAKARGIENKRACPDMLNNWESKMP